MPFIQLFHYVFLKNIISGINKMSVFIITFYGYFFLARHMACFSEKWEVKKAGLFYD